MGVNETCPFASVAATPRRSFQFVTPDVLNGRACREEGVQASAIAVPQIDCTIDQRRTRRCRNERQRDGHWNSGRGTAERTKTRADIVTHNTRQMQHVRTIRSFARKWTSGLCCNPAGAGCTARVRIARSIGACQIAGAAATQQLNYAGARAKAGGHWQDVPTTHPLARGPEITVQSTLRFVWLLIAVVSNAAIER